MQITMLHAPNPHSIFTCSLDDSGTDDSAVAVVGAWSVRRRLDSVLKSGFEPLERLCDGSHLQVAYEEKWMTSVAERVREKENQQKKG
jgi:hypothetical protein